MTEFEKNKLNRVKRGANRANYDTKVIDGILNAGFLAHVGYLYDGYPISIPMAYAYENGKIYLHGSNGNRMMSSILEAGKTSINVTHLDGLVLARSGLHHSVNYRSVTLFGTVKKIKNDELKEWILEETINNMTPNRWKTLRKITQEELNRTQIIEFTINHASAKIRAEGVNDEPEDYQEKVWAGVIPIQQIAKKPIPDKGYPETVDYPVHIKEYYENNR